MVFKKSYSNEIKGLIKENQEYLNIEVEAIKHTQELLLVLKIYVDSEVPSLNNEIFSLESAYKGIKDVREEKIANLREKCIGPLVELLDRFNILQEESKEAVEARKVIRKFQKTVDRERMKRIKGRISKLNQAQEELHTAITHSKKEQQDVVVTTEVFNKKKVQIIQAVIKNLITIEKIYHKKVIDFFKSLEKKEEEIKNYEKEF